MAIAVLTKWSLTTASLIGVGFVAVAVLSTMAILFCFLWIRQIRDFKKLNTAKFAILNEMAPKLDFHPEKPGEMTSFRPFEKEWEKLDELGALSKVGRSKIVALKSSNIEFFIPRAFAALFASIVLALVLVTVFNWPLRKLVQPTGSTTGNTPAHARQP